MQKRYKQCKLKIWYTHTLSKTFENVDFQIWKIICFQDVPIYFLIFLKCFGIRKAINTGFKGPEMTNNRSKN